MLSILTSVQAKAILGALDYKYDSEKKRTGNEVVKRRDYFKVNNLVPSLKGTKVPAWAVNQKWAEDEANVDLEKKSRPNIDNTLTVMPQVEEVKLLLHQYVPDTKTHVLLRPPPKSANSWTPTPLAVVPVAAVTPMVPVAPGPVVPGLVAPAITPQAATPAAPVVQSSAAIPKRSLLGVYKC